jgi:TRAP-type mannitol/chloroaromatic compound transport system substrate-binding protein
LRYIPQDIVEEAIDIARATMSGQYTEDPDAAKKKLLDAFAAVRVTPKMLEEYLGHKTSEISLDEWNDLRGLYRGIKEGTTHWREVIERKNARNAPPTDLVEDAADESEDPTRGE